MFIAKVYFTECIYIYICCSERVRDHTHTLYYQFIVTQVKI